jgi:Tfp pilus assembly protein PilO
MTPLLQRVFTEYRRIVVVLAVLLFVNVGVYALGVYPMTARRAALERRAEQSRSARVAAQKDLAAAKAMVSSEGRAQGELKTFYQDVLPTSLAGARRITYARLAQLARDANLRYERRSYEPDTQYEGALRRLRITMVLEGEYRDVRRFIHAVESATEFIVIENVSLAESNQPDAPLTLTLALATYYRDEADGQ